MLATITAAQAQAALDSVKEQFADFIAFFNAYAPSVDMLPTLHRPGVLGDHWCIAWGNGPEGWALRAFVAHRNEATYQAMIDMNMDPNAAELAAATPAAPRPEGVHVEALTRQVLSLSPA